MLPIWAHSLLPLPVLPVGFCLLTGVAGVIRRKPWMILTGMAVLWVSSMDFVGRGLLRTLEIAHPAITTADCPQADAIVVLGGAVRGRSATGAIEWRDAVDRFDRGVELIKAGKAPVLLFSAAPLQEMPGVTEGELLREEAFKQGLTAQQVLVTAATVVNTAGEARAVKEEMARRGWRRVIVTTSAYHMKRAMELFRHEGVDAIAFPANVQAQKRVALSVMDFVPQADALLKTERALREWEGIAYYRVVHAISR